MLGRMKSVAATLSARILACVVLALTAPINAAAEPSPRRLPVVISDVVVYGLTSAGVAAAVQAARMGKTVSLVGSERHLGGMTASGLGRSDSGETDTVGGISREFFHRIWLHYQALDSWNRQTPEQFGPLGTSDGELDELMPAMWRFEPHVAEMIFEQMVAEHPLISVFPEHWLDRDQGISWRGNRIRQIRMLTGERFDAQQFIDATYEGDLMAAAGVDYHVGRESFEQYGERWNGVQTGIFHHHHFFSSPISPYVVSGDPASGLLPNVSADPPGVRGEGDRKIQAYNFRMCLTDAPDNRLPFTRPDGYDRSNYELLARVFESGWRGTFNRFDRVPNLKTDVNNFGPVSTNNIGGNYLYPEASYAERAAIVEEHRLYQQGLLYFLSSDPAVPAEVQSEINRWGFPADEFIDNDGWPHQIYVREARRMVGQYVMTEHDCFRDTDVTEPVGLGSYPLDSHNTQRYITEDGFVQNEGDIGVFPDRPYPIAKGALLPLDTQCKNLTVPVCVSSSHIAFGSIRMEPVFMILAQSAATIACLAIDQETSVQNVSYVALRERLLRDGQILEYDGILTGQGGVSPETQQGIVLDSSQGTKIGNWRRSHSRRRFLGVGYLHDAGKGDGNSSVSWTIPIETPGRYRIRIAYTHSSNRATNVPVSINGQTFLVDQRIRPRENALWKTVVRGQLSDSVTITIANEDTDGIVVADAVQLLRLGT